jgi:cyanophycinase-like exopeptidase
VIDAISESYTNISEADADKTMSLFDVRLHIMSADDTFDIATRRPKRPEQPGQRPELVAVPTTSAKAR